MLDAEWSRKADALLALRPAFEAAEREPDRLGRWQQQPGHWPFFAYASPELSLLSERVHDDGWLDVDYLASPALDRLHAPDGIASLTLRQVASVLTWVVRGERFCDGHMAACVADGTVSAVLRRLDALRETPGTEAPPGSAGR